MITPGLRIETGAQCIGLGDVHLRLEFDAILAGGASLRQKIIANRSGGYAVEWGLAELLNISLIIRHWRGAAGQCRARKDDVRTPRHTAHRLPPSSLAMAGLSIP